MNKSQLKQLIREVVEEMYTDDRADFDVDIDLSKLGKGMTGIIQDVPINYTHDSISVSGGEAPSMDSPGDDEEFNFDITYTANQDTTDSSGNLVFEKGEEIPAEAISARDREKIESYIIDDYKRSQSDY